MDAYGNQFKYIGSSTTGEKGGTYVEVGPYWKGILPANLNNATKIQSPTNLVWIIGRIQVNGPTDLKNVREIQDKITLTPVLKNRISKTATANTTTTPIVPTAHNIEELDIPYFDIMSKSLAENPPPANQSYLIKKFETIGIGPGKIPSRDVTNKSIIKALEAGIHDGQILTHREIPMLYRIIDTPYIYPWGDGWSFILKTALWRRLPRACSWH
jgi:hypothetical protein